MERFVVRFENGNPNSELNGTEVLVREIEGYEHHYFISNSGSHTAGGRLLKKHCTKLEGMNIGDVVWFQCYDTNEPIQGRINDIGTSTQLGMNWDIKDTRIFYELRSLDSDVNEGVFTRTTNKYLSINKQNWKKV